MKIYFIQFIILIVIFYIMISCSTESEKVKVSPPVLSLDSMKQLVLEELKATNFDTIAPNQTREIIEDAKELIEAGHELLEEKRKNDSIKLLQRERTFAYQLGLPFKKEKLLFEVYKKLSDTKAVYAFKIDRNEYVLIKYEGKSEEELDDELEAYKTLYGAEVIGNIKKIDLVKECGKRKMPILTGKIRVRRDTTEINCLTCEK
jgi:hypothetical protein